MALLGRWGLSILYPTTPEVMDYAPLLGPLVLATVCTVAATVLCHLLTIAREMRGLILGNLAGLAAALLASQPLLRAFDVYGAAWATILGIGRAGHRPAGLPARSLQKAVCGQSINSKMQNDSPFP